MMRIIQRWVCLMVLWSGLAGQVQAGISGADCEIASRQLALAGGVMHYHQAGSGSPVLLLHGLFASKEQWDGLLCRLAVAGYAAIAPDLPGYGQSVDFPVTVYPLEQQAALLHQFMEQLGVARFELAGNSMGGAIAALYARQFPRQVRTLAFIGAPLGAVGWGDAVREAIFRGVNPFIPVDTAQFDLEMRLLFVNPPLIPEDVKQAAVKDYVARNRHYQQVWSIIGFYDRLLSSRRIWTRLPTLILWGQADAIYPVAGARPLQRYFPRGQRITLPRSGHLLQVENPDETAMVYLDFLRRHARR